MSDNPNLTAVGDEPIEARIVAWVLGDASAFEAAELDRLCEERPELLVFRRRMRALHGLLTEAEAAEPDHSWQLTPEKRKALDEIFGEPEPEVVPITAAKPRRRFPHWGLSVLAACLLMMLVPVALLSRMGGCSATMPKSAIVMESPTIVTYSASADNGDRAETERGVHALKKAIRTQEETVAQTKKVLENVTASRGISLQRQDAGNLVPGQAGRGGDVSGDDLVKADDAVKKGLSTRDYVDAKRTFESEQDLLQQMKIKLQAEEIAASMPTVPGGLPPLMVFRGLEDSAPPVPAKPSSATAATVPPAAKEPLKLEYPPELLEGTPKPMILPAATPAPGRPSSAVATADAATGEPIRTFKLASALSMDEESAAPAAPPPPPALAAAAAADEAHAATKSKAAPVTGPATATPAPDTAAITLNDTLSAADDFGTGFGGGGGAKLGGDTLERKSRETATRAREPRDGEPRKEAELTADNAKGDALKLWNREKLNQAPGDTALALEGRQTESFGLRAGDGAVSRGNIDAVLDGLKDAGGLAGEKVAKEQATADSHAFFDRSGAVPESKPAPVAEPAKAGTGTIVLTDGAAVINGGTFTDLNGRVAGRELDEKLGEDRQKLARGPAGPAAKVPTLGDLPVGGRLFDSNGPVPAEGEGQPVVKNEEAKQVADAKGGKDLGRFRTAASERDEPIRTDPAMATAQDQNANAVRLNLYKAEGAYNLGKFDQAKGEYEKALRVDPSNSAARRGLEQLAAAKSSYYRAAYDHTRAELLMEVDKAWELPAPADGKPSQPQPTLEIIREFDSRRAGGKPEDVNAPALAYRYALTPETAAPGQPPAFPTTPAAPQGWAIQDEATKAKADDGQGWSDVVVGGVKRDLSGLAEREMIRRAAPAAEADRFVTEARDAYANGDFQKAYTYHEKALGLLPDAPMLKDKRESLRESLGQTAVALAEQAASQGRGDESRTWFSKALEWNPNNEAARKLQMIDPASETSAATEPYSTVSLSISDASFKTAQAALAKGERPDPAGIRVEQFYNAVDYGDPAPGAGEPVAATVEQAAHPVVPGRNLVRVALRTGATGRSASQPLQLTLLVDQSGSMAREDRRAAMAQALTQLAGLLGPNDRLTVVGFSLTARMLADGMKGDQAGKLPTLVNQAASEGGTNLEGALLLAKQLAEARKLAGAQNRIVLFTDGAANLGNADPAQLAETVKSMRQAGLAFDVAGIGTSELNDRLLAELARHGNGRFYVVDSAAGANDGFAKQLAGAFRPAAENVKVQVRFNPQRVGAYKLIGFEEHRLNKEDFRNDAVDAAELAAEEAGVALYQVEPLPAGTGELGEVSVRFRDAATGQMVERSWTIPYDSSAPAFDRAAPSMQLAGLAMLAAEKLRGGPLAEAVDFSQFANPRATVQQFYPNNRRVAEVLEMVGALR